MVEDTFSSYEDSYSTDDQLRKKEMAFNELYKKVKKGKAQIEDLFVILDIGNLTLIFNTSIFLDDSGGISETEFRTLLQRLHFNFSDHRIAEIYTKVKKGKRILENELDKDGCLIIKN